jgi:carbonic anhydrase
MPQNPQSLVSRRHLLQFGSGAIGTGVLTAGLKGGFVTPQPAIAKENLTPDQAIEMLMSGNQRFVTHKRKNPHQELKIIGGYYDLDTGVVTEVG